MYGTCYPGVRLDELHLRSYGNSTYGSSYAPGYGTTNYSFRGYGNSVYGNRVDPSPGADRALQAPATQERRPRLRT